jgi:hypothetical protein
MFGGAMLLLDSNSIIYECDFNGNQAIDPVGEGGAIYCASSAAKFYDCEINNNQSTTSGGGAYFTGGLEPNMHNCLITHNNTGRDGGGISANWDTQLTLENCTIGHNAIGGSFASGFGGGLSCAYESNTKIINSILWNNNAAYGPEISIGSNFDAADKLKAEVTVSYSDVKGGAADVFVDNAHGCKLNWDYTTNLAGTSLTNPLAVSGYFGDYYLSQPTDQTITSPCVDSGSGLAIDNDMYRHTTRTDHVRVKGLAIDSNIVDMGYHYTLAAEILGDFNFDGVVDISDFILFEQYWMNSGCTFPYFCHGRDLTEDGEVDFEDFAAFAENWNQEETTPPKPDPMTWAVKPHSAAITEVAMTATTARDNSGSLIQYYFDCYSGNCHDRSWDTNSAYTDSGLTEGNPYGYRVKAKDERGNETEWSVIAYAVPGVDDVPPQPKQMTWTTAPYPTSSSSIRMVATTATDTSGVEYYFDCVSPGCHDCNWQADTAYEDFGLEPNTTYTYKVKAHDKSPAYNETYLSESASATTSAIGQPNEPNGPDKTPPTYTPTVYGIWVARPYAYYNSSTLYWYHRMTAVAATDSSLPLTYWFHCVSGFSDDYWTTNQGGVEVTYDAGPFTGQNYNTTYEVHIIDNAGNEVVSSAWRVYDSHF